MCSRLRLRAIDSSCGVGPDSNAAERCWARRTGTGVDFQSCAEPKAGDVAAQRLPPVQAMGRRKSSRPRAGDTLTVACAKAGPHPAIPSKRKRWTRFRENPRPFSAHDGQPASQGD
jgi:hypothetical protein